MKAAVLYGIGNLRYEEVEIPQLKKGEALIKVRACGICGSDIPRVMEKGTYSFPLIPGHEFSGEVVKIRGKAQGIKEGDRITVFPLIPCYKCPYCKVGRYNLCEDYNYLGSRCNGGFAEYVKAPIENLIKIPQKVSYEEAALTEPASVALHALRRAKMDVGDKIAILGAGPIGVLLAQWARIWGAGEVFLIDIERSKLEVAREYGFTKLVNATERNPVEEIIEETEGRGVDIVVEAAGAPITFKESMELARKGGKVIFLGNMRGEVALPEDLISSILRKELTLYGTWNSSFTPLPKNEWATSLQFMEKGKLKVKPLITHRFKLKQAKEAFQMMYEKREFYNKVMFISG
jgi:L-iditol 2-dehydrogenase